MDHARQQAVGRRRRGAVMPGQDNALSAAVSAKLELELGATEHPEAIGLVAQRRIAERRADRVGVRIIARGQELLDGYAAGGIRCLE